MNIILGTRGSKLALAQTELVIKKIQEIYSDVTFEVKVITTKGDLILDKSLDKIGDKGVFVAEIEQQLQEQVIDIAVHSMKDMPTEDSKELELVPVLKREVANDVILTRLNVGSLSELLKISNKDKNKKIRIGTGSKRRSAQIKKIIEELFYNQNYYNSKTSTIIESDNNQKNHPNTNTTIESDNDQRNHQNTDTTGKSEFDNIEILPIRGNVITRIDKMLAGEFDAIVLAEAGINRLGLKSNSSYKIIQIDVDELIPAPAQGILACQFKKGNERIKKILESITDFNTVLAANVEREYLRQINGGCHLPVGAYLEINETNFTFRYLYGDEECKHIVKDQITLRHNCSACIDETVYKSLELLASTAAKSVLEKVDRV